MEKHNSEYEFERQLEDIYKWEDICIGSDCIYVKLWKEYREKVREKEDEVQVLRDKLAGEGE